MHLILYVTLSNMVCIKQCRTEEQHVCSITLRGVCVTSELHVHTVLHNVNVFTCIE